MYEAFFNFLKPPFVRDIPESELYSNPGLEELCGRLGYVARNRLFAVITGDVGIGKSTAIRKFVTSLDSNRYKVMYISDSALTPRNFYWEVLNQLGCEAKFYRGDAKRQLSKEMTTLIESHKKNPVIITDEAHLLSREMLAYFGQTGHRFRFKLDRHSGLNWTVIPAQTGQIGAKRRTRKLAYGIIII